MDFWTSREVREVTKSHLNYVVADTKQWEQSAAYCLDKSNAVEAFVKNSGLGFAIPYLHNGQMHDYVPDFIIRIKTGPVSYLILETKGYDPLEDRETGCGGSMGFRREYGWNLWEVAVCSCEESVRRY